MEIISVKDKLPENKTYVLAHYNRRNWHDSDDINGCLWKVVKFIRGLSIEDRQNLSIDNPRRNRYKGSDEFGNNEKPYCWYEFGPGSFFGQDVDYWSPLPEIK